MKRILILAVFVAVVLTAAYTVITLYDTNLKVGRMWETPAVRPHEQKLLIMEPGVVPFGGGEAEYRNAKGEDLISPFKSDDPKVVASGKSLYFTYCAQCHGKYHDGNGTVGQSFHPLPGDLQSARVQSLPQGTLFKEISYGVPNGRQPALATTIEMMDRWRIIAYVKSLGLRK
ncbi:MAG: c-type cytochrome [Desulfobacterales bacterium]|jgi:mono/diheme cytochrome c family protein|nr:c-type cytochrome [Desulfobacterales bacterium]